MIRGALTSYMDVAQVVLYAFFAFFAMLIWYLRREDRREGYPLESEATGRAGDRGFMLVPSPKTFLLANGSIVKKPNFERDTRVLNAVKLAPWPGAPLVPTGNPLTAGVGPGAYAMRADVAEHMHDGRELIVPMRIATNYAVAAEDADPIGYDAVGADFVVGGRIVDLWIDRAESVLRFYEIETGAAGAGHRVLLPVTFARVDAGAGRINVQALRGEQIAGVPATKSPDKVTMLEEEMIMAYYGAGTLYATPRRAEPLL